MVCNASDANATDQDAAMLIALCGPSLILIADGAIRPEAARFDQFSLIEKGDWKGVGRMEEGGSSEVAIAHVNDLSDARAHGQLAREMAMARHSRISFY